MIAEVTHEQRELLRYYVNEVRNADFTRFSALLLRLWNHLISKEPYASLLKSVASHPQSEEMADRILSGHACNAPTYEQDAAVAYWVMKKTPRQKELLDLRGFQNAYAKRSDGNLLADKYKEIIVYPLLKYVDSQLAVKGNVLASLVRYKHKCEWFRREDLHEIYATEKGRASQIGKNSRAENHLSKHLYEFLFDQGLQFSIEPQSVSGEADFVNCLDKKDPLVADVKIFDPLAGKNKAYVISGFHQVYQYTLDYNVPSGYMVIFKTCEEGLAITSGKQEQSSQFVTWNGKTIFFVIIDLHAHSKSASQRGKLKSFLITEDEFINQHVDTEEPHDVSDTQPAASDVTGKATTTEVNE